MTEFADLKDAGRVATPADADWDEARLAWNLAADLRPEAVAFVRSAEDVAATVSFAAANGQRAGNRPRGRGRSAPRGRGDPPRRRLRPPARGQRSWDPENRIVANHAISPDQA